MSEDKGQNFIGLAQSQGKEPKDLHRDLLQQSFGHDFGGVSPHTGSSANKAAGAMGARAFATSGKIAFGDGLNGKTPTSGQRLLGHELTHAVQQGAVKKP